MTNTELARTQANVGSLISQNLKAIKTALPSHLKPERMARICFNQISKNPELMTCDAHSLMGSVLKCSELGLEPGGAHDHIYLIPFNNKKKGIKEVNLIVSYQGMMDLARRAGIKRIYADIVRENDKFEYSQGFDPYLKHVIVQGADRGALTNAYAIAKDKDGDKYLIVLERDDIEKARKASKTSGFIWNNHYEAMAKKTAIRRLAKWLPLSAEKEKGQEILQAIEMENTEAQPNAEYLAEKAEIVLPTDHTEKEPNALVMIQKTTAELDIAVSEGFECKKHFGREHQEIISGMVTENDCIEVLDVIRTWSKEK